MSSTTTRDKQVAFLVFNFVSTIAVTFINKAVFSRISFGFPAALCNVHYVVTWLGVEGLRRLGVFEPLVVAPKSLDGNFWAMVMVVGVVTPLNNTSLKLNGMGSYQIFKLLVTPVVVLLDFWLDGKLLSWPRAACLATVCLCVVVSSTSDYEFSWTGTLCATIWVPLAAIYKVQWGRLLKQLGGCSTLALMHVILPYAMVIQSFISPLVDPPGLLQYQWTTEAVLLIGVSGVAAFLVNYSGFLVMGNLGALAHVLLGQLKTSVIMVGASFLFGSRYSELQIAGAAGAVAAIVAYTHVTVTEKSKKTLKDEDRAEEDVEAANPSGKEGKEEPTTTETRHEQSNCDNLMTVLLQRPLASPKACP